MATDTFRNVCLFFLISLGFVSLHADEAPVPEHSENWQAVIREAPYWSSQGVFANMLSVRRWVLFGSGYCTQQERHLLFDRRGRFIAYVSDQAFRRDTQRKLNSARAEMARTGRVETWVPGGENVRGYPFALACTQPHVDMKAALERYFGEAEEGRIWGSWDTLKIGTREQPLSLHSALQAVYRQRTDEGRLDLPAAILEDIAGQLLIESGGQARAHSTANARGILQLSPPVLDDCRIPAELHWHRLAQMDCALRLTEKNYRNLRPAFERRFGHLLPSKQKMLFRLLLTQAYHGGTARVLRLLDDTNDQGAAARYFAAEHERFSAGDIAFGMLFHNLDRDLIGFSSLYYGADVRLAAESIEARLPSSASPAE